MEPPQDVEKVSNAEDNHNRRVHSLYTAPLFQRISQTNLENMQARGSEFSSTAWNVQGRDKPSNLSKVESKEGPGYRLLNMLRKTLKGSENKAPEVTHEAPSLVPFGDVVGCLAIHIRNCKHFTPKIISQHYSNLFICISINNVVKCTKTCSLLSQNTEKDIMITFDEVKYFSVQVPRRQDDEKNNIRLELMQHDNTKKYLLLLGSVQVHLYEVIQKGCFTGELVLNKNTFICRVEVEFMFSYGNFGYGFSHQLKPLQKIIKPSMFMDIAPPPERTDPVTNVIIPQPIAYPAFLSPDLNVTVGVPATSQSNQPSVVQLEKLQQQPRERLEKMKKEYRHLSTWAEKASYLEGLLTPGLEHKEPKESNINEIPESQLEERPTDTVTSGVSLIKEEAETIPSELLDNDDKKGLSLPTLNQSSKDDSSVVAPKTDMPSKETDTPLSTIPRLSITEENQIPPLEEHQQEAMPVKKMKNLFFLPEEKLKDRYPSLLKTDLHPSEVVFSPKEYISPCFKPEYTEFKPAYQDCSDRFEELHVTSFKHLENAKSRARLLEKSPDDSHNQFKRFARPYTAPEVNKRGESYTGKFTSPRMVSAGLVHINDSIPEYEIHKMRPKKKIKREY
uniref:C2 domain-containing protein n=1 Tax=Bos mutus grunniens TaxID=30521 RepID=A0A8C0AIS8_BOSMU